MGKDNSAAGDMKIYREDLAKMIRESWADGERTIVVKVAETMRIKGIIAAWEVHELKFKTSPRDDGVLVLKAVDSENQLEIPYPEGDMRQHSEEYLKREPGKPVQVRIRSPVGEAQATHSWEVVGLEPLQYLSTQLMWLDSESEESSLRKRHRKGIEGTLGIGANLLSSRIPECVVLFFHKIETIEWDLNHSVFC
jgi:hypothetical protein